MKSNTPLNMALNLIVIKIVCFSCLGKTFHEYIYLTTTFTGQTLSPVTVD